MSAPKSPLNAPELVTLRESATTLLSHLDAVSEPLSNYVNQVTDELYRLERDPGWKVFVGYRRFRRYFLQGSGKERLQFIQWAGGVVKSRVQKRPNHNPFKGTFELPYPTALVQNLPATLESPSPESGALPEALGDITDHLARILDSNGDTPTLGAPEEATVIEELKALVASQKVLGFTPTIEWGERLFQRPQQLALAYSQLGYRVLYFSLAERHDAPGLTCINPNLYVVAGLSTAALREALSPAAEVTLSVSWTLYKHYIDELPCHRFIYEYIDDLTVFDRYSEEMEQDHQTLARNADVVVATARNLYESVREHNPNTLYLPNAGDYEHFNRAKGDPLPKDLADIARRHSRVFGYYGALARWMDYDLIGQLANACPDAAIVLIGVDYDGSLAKARLDRYPNVYCLGSRSYGILPRYLQGFDVAIIPFLVNTITEATSPIKLFEYMAGHRPIVTTALPECHNYQCIHLSPDAASFIENCQRACGREEDPNYLATLEAEARGNTWLARARTIAARLKEAPRP